MLAKASDSEALVNCKIYAGGVLPCVLSHYAIVTLRHEMLMQGAAGERPNSRRALECSPNGDEALGENAWLHAHVSIQLTSHFYIKERIHIVVL